MQVVSRSPVSDLHFGWSNSDDLDLDHECLAASRMIQIHNDRTTMRFDNRYQAKVFGLHEHPRQPAGYELSPILEATAGHAANTGWVSDSIGPFRRYVHGDGLALGQADKLRRQPGQTRMDGTNREFERSFSACPR